MINRDRVQRVIDVINTETDLPEILDGLCAESFPEFRSALESGAITVGDGGDLKLRELPAA